MQKTILLQLVILVCILSCQSNQDVEVLPPGIKFIKKYYKNDTLFLEEHYNTDSTYSFSKEKDFRYCSRRWLGGCRPPRRDSCCANLLGWCEGCLRQRQNHAFLQFHLDVILARYWRKA